MPGTTNFESLIENKLKEISIKIDKDIAVLEEHKICDFK